MQFKAFITQGDFKVQQREMVSGFSELKDLLVRTYKIDRSRDLVKLYFSETGNELLMHDYDNHKNVVRLSSNMLRRAVWEGLTGNAQIVVSESLNQASPAVFLNDEFKLYGFFKF